MTHTIPTFLTIAGSDPSGGAGLQADLRVAQSLGCYGMAIVTALTAQNTMGVEQVWPLSFEQVVGQGTALFKDINPDAIKIGMLGDEAVAMGVMELLSRYGNKNVVIDTVMQSTSGANLFKPQGGDVFNELLKYARVITPNLPEASLLSQNKIENLSTTARSLSQACGGVSVYLKGGHTGEGDCITDTFYNAETDNILQFTQPRIITKNTHGTGCTLSSALASYLAKGFSLDDAARQANLFMHNALRTSASYELGHGHGPAFIL